MTEKQQQRIEILKKQLSGIRSEKNKEKTGALELIDFVLLAHVLAAFSFPFPANTIALIFISSVWLIFVHIYRSVIRNRKKEKKQ